MWPPDILRHGFVPVPRMLLRHARDLGLTLDDLGFLVQLLSFHGPEGIHPSIKTLQARCGFRSPDPVISRINRLVDKGILAKRIVRDKHGRFAGCIYSIRPMLEKLRVLTSSTPAESVTTESVIAESVTVEPINTEEKINTEDIKKTEETIRSLAYTRSIVRLSPLLSTRSIEPNGSRDVKRMTEADFIKALREIGLTDDEIGGSDDDQG